MLIHPLPVLAAAVAAFILGAVWYTALSRPWQAALGRADDEIKTGGAPPPLALLTTFVAELIIAVVLSLLLHKIGRTGILSGLKLSVICWLFVVTTVAVNNAYPGRKLALTVIDSAHWLLVLAAEGAIIGALH